MKWTAGNVALVLGAIAGILHSTHSHSVGIGRCDPVNSQPDFDPDQFTGLWYVIEIFSTTSKCMTMTFNRTESGFTVTEGREFYLARMINLDHTARNTGTFTFKNDNNKAVMRAKWPSNFLGTGADVTVVDTDYINFAVMFECQSFLVINRHSAVILSRTPTLEAAIVQKVKDDLAKSGVDIDDFDIMDHRSCNVIGEADFNWEFDSNTFGGIAETIGDAIPNIPAGVTQEDFELWNANPEFNEVL